MQQNKEFEIIKTHICSLERDSGVIRFDIEKYPERVCILDKARNIVIDVETKHQYPFLETMSMLYVINKVQLSKLKSGERVGVITYAWIPRTELSSKMMNECEKIIKALKSGESYPSGNEVLTNEQYLDLINKEKEKKPKIYKISKKRK